jgi:hypothetical protein
MNEPDSDRITFENVDPRLPLEQQKRLVVDSGRRRHLSWGMDFDSRALSLDAMIPDHWDKEVKELHRQNLEAARAGMIAEFGELGIDAKIENFIAIGVKPFSVLAHHNALFHQVRQAFVIGAYYPALVGACALGERILNHLMLDMRDHFKATPEYRKVYRKDSFDDWRVPIETLDAWGILLPDAVIEYRALMALRHRSIHFNAATVASLRDDALAAIVHMRTIIEQQFATHALRPWFIPNTLGHAFIRKDYETDPYVRTYFVPNCPFVGPLFGMAPGPNGWRFFDRADYGDGDWTDAEFAAAYNDRDPEQVTGPSS